VSEKRLSVCCMTRGPGGRVSAILELFRPLADEIVVALDDRAGPNVAAALAGVADRLLGYAYAEPVDRPLPWLFRQCSGSWVLLWDDDEVPSGALLEALPGLLAADDVTGVWLPRRWLYPHPGSYLDAPPWRPDYQLRLLANDLRLLRFPNETHWQLTALGPSRYVDPPLYHADLVLNPLDARERKAGHYERLLPGKRIAGRPLNEAFYLPERAERAPTAPVPEEDAELIRHVLAAEAAPGRAPAVRVASREEIDRHWEGRVLAPEDYRAALELRDEALPLVAGEGCTLDVRVENRGGAVWPWGDARPEIRLSYRWWRGHGVAAEGLRTPLPAELEPGESALVPLALEAPGTPGRYRLAVDLVHEHVRWFGCGFDVELDVLPRRRLAVVGPVEPERVAALEPELEPLLLADDPDALRGRYAGAVGPSAAAFLLPGLPDGRLTGGAVLLARTARLLVSTRRRRSRFAREFVDALATCEAAYVVAEGERRRARWVAWATALAARSLGLRTTLR
jgi:hypothetical protein